MNRIVLAMLAVIALSGCTTRDSAMTNTQPAFNAEDESAVRALVNEFANTWTRHDMKAMHELDTEDVEWINVVGSTDPRYSWVVASKSRASFTMVKRDGIWKIVHFQNTVIDPKAENVDETKFDATGFPPPGDQTPYSVPGHQPPSAR